MYKQSHNALEMNLGFFMNKHLWSLPAIMQKSKQDETKKSISISVLVEERGRMRIARVARADRKITVTHITTLYTRGEQKSISCGNVNVRSQQVPLMSANNKKLKPSSIVCKDSSKLDS